MQRPNPTSGQPMSASQLQELQKMQRLQQQMQAQIRQQQQNAIGQRQQQQTMGNTSSGSLGGMTHGLQQQMQQAQLGSHLYSDQAGAGNQQGGQRNSLTGMNTAISLMQQQNSAGGRTQMAGMGDAGGAQAALYWNAMQASSKAGTGAGGQDASSSQLPSAMTGSGNMNMSESSMQALLQQQSGTMGLGSTQQRSTQQMQQRNDPDTLSQQLQRMGSSSSSLLPGAADTNPHLAAGSTSAQLLMHQQKMMANLKRQLQGQAGVSNTGLSSGSAGSMMTTTSHDRRPSASLSGQERQALFQMQRSSSITNALGGMQDQSSGRIQERRSSLGSIEPISMATLLASQNQSGRRGSGASQTNPAVMGSLLTGSTGGGTSAAASLLVQQQAQLRQQLAGSDNEHLIAQQRLLSNAGMTPIVQDSSLAGQSSSRSNSLLSQPDSQVQQMMADAAASDAANRPSPDAGGASAERILEKRRSSKSKRSSKISSQTSGDVTSETEQQSYLDGTFEGGWQSNADLPERRSVIFSIVKLIEQMRPDADKMSQKLPQMAKRLEEHLYRSAGTKEEYLDPTTLKRRLQSVAQGLEVHRSSSMSEPQMLFGQANTDDTELSEAERRTQSLQKQLQQMQQLQHLQQQGSSEDYISQQAKILSMQQAGLSGALSGGSQTALASVSQLHSAQRGEALGGAASDMASSSSAHHGILKTGKYQDPAAAQKRKVVKQQQQRLLLLRHASKCTAGAACKTKFCGQMVTLWQHMKRCRDKNCKTAHCLSSRCVLNHYRVCKNQNQTSTCDICAPVMRQIKWQQNQAEEEQGSPKGEAQVDSSSVASLSTGSGQSQQRAVLASISPQKRERMEELQATQQKLQQQQALLKQLKQQQANLVEQQQQLRLQQQHVHPHTQQGQQLQQQQGLLQQLQQLFQQQQLLLQQELVRQSQAVGDGHTGESVVQHSEPLPLVPTDSPTEERRRTSKSGKKGKRSSASNRGKSAKGRSSKGKRLSTMEAIASASESGGSAGQSVASTEKLKRPADQISSSSKTDGVDDTRPTKLAKQAPDDSHGDTSRSSDHVRDAGHRPKAPEQGSTEHTTSLIQSMQKAAVESHLESLNEKLHLTPKTISQRCLPLIRKLIDDQFGWVFRDPVDPVVLGLPDYFDVVKNPMHLTLVETKLNSDGYCELESFFHDTKLVFDNAILYNGEDSEVGQMAAVMLRHFEKDYKAMLKAIESDRGNMKGRVDMCTLCGSERRLFEPTALYCNGACGMQKIRRKATYYTDRTKQNHWCSSCFSELDENEPVVLEDGSEVQKSVLQKFKNDALPEEAWVQCDACNGWVHQICALFNGRRNKTTAAYLCPKCHIKKAPQPEIPRERRVKVARDLPHCTMSVEIENGLNRMLTNAYETRAKELGVDVSAVEKAEGLCVRVISDLEKKHLVRDEMYKRYEKHGSPSDFPVRSKCIALFQTLHGVDVILFAMYVYEYGQSCPSPNRRRVYISYLDSVRYMEPSRYRTTVYHGIMLEYLRYVKERGFHTAHIWSCPPSPDDDYIFYCHPKDQLIPREDMLRQWYHAMLDKAKADGIVLETRTLYDEYFKNNGMDATAGQAVDPTSIPYFEGDYIPGEIENIIKEVRGEEEAKRQERFSEVIQTESNRKTGKKKGTRSNPGELVRLGQDKVMLRLGQAIYNMRDNFIVAHLLSRDFASAVERGEDVTDWVEEDHLSNKRVRIYGKDPSILRSSGRQQDGPPGGGNAESVGTNEDLTSHDSAVDDKLSAIATSASIAKDATGGSKNGDFRAAPSGERGTQSLDGIVGSSDPAKPVPVTNREIPDSNITTVDSGEACATKIESNLPDESQKHGEFTEASEMNTASRVDSGEACATKIESDLHDQPQKHGEGTGASETNTTSRDPEGPSDSSVEAKTNVEHSSGDSRESVVSPSVAVKQEDLPGDGEAGAKISTPEKSSLDDRKDESPHPDSARKDEPVQAQRTADEGADGKPMPAHLGTEESRSVALVSKNEDSMKTEPTTQSAEVTKSTKKRSFDEIESTLTRHVSSVKGVAKLVGTTEDKDEPQETEMFESRQQFLNYCQGNHFQFDELRRAKHSTMMVLFQLHNPSAPMFLQQCGACYRDITHGTRYHCTNCSNFDLCQDCYKPVTAGLWAKRDSRFTHDKSHSFVAIDMEAPAATQKSRDEQARTIKMHLELLSHAATCDGPPACSLNNCQRMKKLFDHVHSCEVTYKKGCKICARLLSLLTMHARMCTVRGSCPLPFCDRIRERNRRRRQQQQLMDDRRRQAQNDLYRNVETS